MPTFKQFCLIFLLTLLSGVAVADDGWRRTAHGWEQSFHWRTPSKAVQRTVRPLQVFHPAILALFQAGASIAVLAVCSRGERKKSVKTKRAMYEIAA